MLRMPPVLWNSLRGHLVRRRTCRAVVAERGRRPHRGGAIRRGRTSAIRSSISVYRLVAVALVRAPARRPLGRTRPLPRQVQPAEQARPTRHWCASACARRERGSRHRAQTYAPPFQIFTTSIGLGPGSIPPGAPDERGLIIIDTKFYWATQPRSSRSDNLNLIPRYIKYLRRISHAHDDHTRAQPTAKRFRPKVVMGKAIGHRRCITQPRLQVVCRQRTSPSGPTSPADAGSDDLSDYSDARPQRLARCRTCSQ